VAGFLYSWDATSNLEVYYAATVRSMSTSWHDFFFAAFDPRGTITVDKLPGAFWVQALAVRVFGLHAWAIVAPQVAAGIASVVVLYHAVRRLAGPVAGLAGAAVLVLSPATVALNRGNVPDTLMVLLLLLAADATVTAVTSGRARSLVWAAIFVGLAFQAKMLEAWLVLPALALAYLLAGPAHWIRRLRHLVATGVLVAAVSLSWMAAVSLWPASSRPYVDGSAGNSIFSQVFDYNGFGRIDQASPNQLLSKAIGIQLGSAPAAWNRLLTGAYGRTTAWLLPAALIALVACLVLSRKERNTLLAASTVLWGGWLVVLLAVFSASSTINAYYTAALSPAIAALLGTGLAQAWARRTSPAARATVAGTVAVTCGYAAWLLPGRGAGLPAGLPEVAVVLGLAAIGAVLRPTRTAARPGAWALAAVAVVAVPAVASGSVVAKAFGPFDTPFEPAGPAAVARQLGSVAKDTIPLLPALENAAPGSSVLMATQTSAVAAPFIYDSGREVVPIGGFTGTIPEPSLAALEAMISRGEFHIVVQAPQVDDPRLVWVARHCLALPAAPAASGGLRFAVYYCGRPG
jgi:4-amino-4-deoxy-L-arabinose transferase-like glycosyltransferase